MPKPYVEITYTEIMYESADGLNLYARDYGQPAGACLGTLFCMHGLTRNAADFDALAQRYRTNYRVISMDQRGRGRSDYDTDAANYRPEIYCEDMFRLITHLKLENMIAVGTSMGGLMAMVMNAMQPAVFKAVILNDIGAVVDPAGIARIRSYVGTQDTFADWTAAANGIKLNNGPLFPNLTDADWLQFARQTCEETSDDRVRFAYDKAISEGIRAADPTAVPPDLWKVFDLLKTTPMLVIRGSMSDLLSRETVIEMGERHTNMHSAEIPDVGHAPMLNEAASLAAIDGFFTRLNEGE